MQKILELHPDDDHLDKSSKTILIVQASINQFPKAAESNKSREVDPEHKIMSLQLEQLINTVNKNVSQLRLNNSLYNPQQLPSLK